MKKSKRRQVLWEAAEYALEDWTYRAKNAEESEAKSLRKQVRRLHRAMTEEHEAAKRKEAPTPQLVYGVDGDTVIVAEKQDGGVKVVAESLQPMEGGPLTALNEQEAKWPAPLAKGTPIQYENGDILITGTVVNTVRDRVTIKDDDDCKHHTVPRHMTRLGPIFSTPTVHWREGDLVEWHNPSNGYHSFGLVQEVGLEWNAKSLKVLVPGRTEEFVWNSNYCRLLRRG